MEADGAKQAFLREFGADYGYPDSATTVDNLRATQFNRLQGTVYLDHAGATLYSEAQMEAVVRDLTSSVYGNPHSQSDSSLATSDMIRAAREQVLDYCNASSKDYRCIFTSGATAALKLVGEAFPWGRESCYMYTMENHNSVLGIREYALEKGARAHAVDIRISEQSSEHPTLSEFSVESSVCIEQRRTKFMSSEGSVDGNTFNLFAFPSECNFSGIKYHLELVNLVKKDMKGILGSSSGSQHTSKGCWMVLIDAAKGCATQPPDLSKYPADFVVLSFYKIFGYPTGLGALIVRNEAAKLLKPTYFSGGTVSASIADIDFVKRRESIEQMFEDGTQSFLSIVSIRHGFRIINMLTTSAIARHTSSLATYVRNILADLKHENGALLCKIYGSYRGKVTSLDMGPTITFNLRRPNRSWFGYREVENLASLSGIQLRTGCFCNPGACAKYLSLSHNELLSNIEAGHFCWDDHDIINGKPTGAVRISFGYMSTFEDAESFLSFMKSSFLSKSTSVRTTMQPLSACTQQLRSGPLLKTIMVYPIKSCAGFSVDSWPLCWTGLLYDREWLLKGANGEVLTQKKVPEMGKIHTYIDIKHQQLLLESASCPDNLKIPLLSSASYEVFSEELDLFGERYEVQSYNEDINMWFTKAVGRHCSLVRCSSSGYQYCKQNGSGRNFCRDEKGQLNFVNEAQLLLISEDSVSDLNVRIKSDKKAKQSELVKPIFVDSLRFRPNLVISGAEPYAEDQWRTLNIGKAHFTSLGGCNRCQMINLDPLNAHVQKSKEPLATLASFRRVKGRILFGILLRYEEQMALGRSEDEACKEILLEVGQEVFINNN